MIDDELSEPVKNHLSDIYDALDEISGSLKADEATAVDLADVRKEFRYTIEALDALSEEMKQFWPGVIGDN